jgi:hypothetical protein
MYEIVQHRKWYYLISALIIIPGHHVRIPPPAGY